MSNALQLYKLNGLHQNCHRCREMCNNGQNV